MDEDQNGPNPPLNADDFVDRPPNREECRQLLEEASGSQEKIRSWNRLMKRFQAYGSAWFPDLSDATDRWKPGGIHLSVDPDGGAPVAASLVKARLNNADLRDAKLKGVWLNEADLQSAQLDGASLENAQLSRANLDHAVAKADMSGANLGHAMMRSAGLHQAYLKGALLNNANLEDAYMSEANLEDAKLVYTNLSKADMAGASFERANLSHACLNSCLTDHATSFKRTKFDQADFGTVPPSSWKSMTSWASLKSRFVTGGFLIEGNRVSDSSSILDGADMRSAINFIPNGQSAIGTIFSPNAVDPYSIVRRKYTGPLMLFNLVFLAIFFTPYIIRAGAWTAYDRAQQTEIGQVYITEGPGAARRALWEQSLDSVGIHDAIESAQADLRAQVPPAFIEHLVAWEAARALEVMESAPDTEREKIIQDDNIETRERSVLMIVLGFEPGFFGTLAGCLSIVFVLYNVLRGVVTWWLSQVRDAEERSGHLPDIRQYWWCYSLHHYFLRYVYWFAVGAFMLNMSRWALTTVSVPI